MKSKRKSCNPSSSEMESKKKLKVMEKSVDVQLWHACAGGMVQIPEVDNKIFYFPQGHAEHAHEPVNFMDYPKIPPFIQCRVAAIKYMAHHETDEVYVKLRLVPLHTNEISFEDHAVGSSGTKDNKPLSFVKILTLSDANNGSGFSCPKNGAQTVFPPLDYKSNYLCQTISPKDIHGQIWNFRHIYRGTPKCHLFTNGWSPYVTKKKLVAGDSIVFLKGENGDIHFGIRRTKRKTCADNNNKVQTNSRDNELRISDGMMGKGKVSAQQVIEAATHAANMQPFEVIYYPRLNSPEFLVKSSIVGAALKIKWCPGMRIKMAFESEDSSNIRWFIGTVASVQIIDPEWSGSPSPWRLLEVTWDEPELLQNLKRVNPWQVEIVSSMPSIHLSPFIPPAMKKMIQEISPASMQGARQNAPLDLLQPFNHTATTSKSVLVPNNNNDNVSRELSISTSTQSFKEQEHVKPLQIVLFGKTIIIDSPSTIAETRNQNAEKM